MIKKIIIECPQCRAKHEFTGDVDSMVDQITEPEGFHNQWCKDKSKCSRSVKSLWYCGETTLHAIE